MIMSESLVDIVTEVLGAEAPEPETPEPEAPDTPAPEEPDAPEEPTDAPEEPAADEDEPWTPERIAEERTALTQERERLQRFHAQEKKRWAKANRKREQWLTEQKAFEDTRASFLEDVKLSRTGSGAQALDALARLTGRPAREIYEEMSLAIAGRPKEEPKEDPNTAALRKELDELKQAQAQREQQAAIQAEVTRLTGIIRDGATEKWPTIAYELEADHQGTINALAQHRSAWHEEHGEWVDWSVLLTTLEPKLRARYSAQAEKLGFKAPEGAPAGPDTSAAQAAKTGGRETPAKHGTTVRQSAKQGSGSKRDLTPEERLAWAAELIPDY